MLETRSSPSKTPKPSSPVIFPSPAALYSLARAKKFQPRFGGFRQVSAFAMPRTPAIGAAAAAQEAQDVVSTQSAPSAPTRDTRRRGRPRAASQPDQVRLRRHTMLVESQLKHL
eukprot:XP_015580385.1 uncharacterized protein LOC107261996 [Ricinus communis]